MLETLALALAVAGGDSAPLAAKGKWQLDYATEACRLSRDYGDGKKQVTAVLERAGDAEGAALYLILPSATGAASSGKAVVRIDPQGLEQQPYYERWTSAPPVHGVVRTWIDADGLGALTSATMLQVRAGSVEVMLAPAMTPSVLSALSKCNDDLQRRWGLDPTEKERVAVPAKPAPGIENWISYDDYPQEALRQRAQGTTTISWTIGVDGRVQDCRTVLSSGNAALDAASCRAITSRGRYTPAMGKDGKPMVTHQTRRVRWNLPGS